ncbi:hypothetical protein Y603_5885 [Burkholderia pseudomallei MSHR1153]|nr:hypothetical protein Y603_5885 [Burkholderia pseudomallei MSHR1153]
MRMRMRMRMQVQVQIVDRGPWTVEQPAQVTACGQAALKGAACGISEPGGRRRKQPSAGVPRACAFQRLAAFTVPMARPAHAQCARRHHCLARDTNDWRRSAHSSYNCRFMSTGSAGCARADSAPHRSTRVRSSPLVARLASCGSKRMRAMRRARARIRERAAACAAIGEGRPGGGRRDTKTNRPPHRFSQRKNEAIRFRCVIDRAIDAIRVHASLPSSRRGPVGAGTPHVCRHAMNMRRTCDEHATLSASCARNVFPF